MKISTHVLGVLLMAALLLAGVSARAAQPVTSGDRAPKGVLELECNISKVDLYLCPRDKFIRKTKEKFFGLFKSHEEICSEGRFFLGTTPLKPLAVAAGQYVLLIPPGYTWEHSGPVEIKIQPEEKLFFLLKLFSRHDSTFGAGPGTGPGEPSAGGSVGGTGSGGAPGTSPP